VLWRWHLHGIHVSVPNQDRHGPSCESFPDLIMMTQEKSQLEYDHQGSGANVWIDRQGVALLLTVVLLGVLLGTAALWIGLR
jgi:hypothetical protein